MPAPPFAFPAFSIQLHRTDTPAVRPYPNTPHTTQMAGLDRLPRQRRESVPA